MKVIARSVLGKEFLYTYKGAFFAPNSSAQKMADIMNANKFQLKDGETWFVHDMQWGDDMKVFQKLFFNRGKLKARRV